MASSWQIIMSETILHAVQADTHCMADRRHRQWQEVSCIQGMLSQVETVR